MQLAGKPADRTAFENEINSLEAQTANLGAHLTVDSSARLAYTREIKRMADNLREQAMRERITWAQAAQQAQETRNLVMGVVRARSSPVGRAMAQKLKANGKTLNEIIAMQTIRAHGKAVSFSTLSVSQKNLIYASIVTSAAKSNVAVTNVMSRLSSAGRGLLGLSLALSVYDIATADDKVAATKREIMTTGAGIPGGMAGGAIAGLACGPGAPVCVAVGAFAGGALAAFGVTSLW
ncbi:hypothetical protein ACFSQU_16820 [Massilia sp. GCM10020059]|uniref:Uncharacterized protein n=1 Tax=Massilia agrisoli TaxID=2892444 RepID=A0ABS8ITQ3_9BURK|nr:hypothetical protein [Massilia agrisoli]MCC6071202.1 hypothetical protein [Massilia agrisoli]